MPAVRGPDCREEGTLVVPLMMKYGSPAVCDPGCQVQGILFACMYACARPKEGGREADSHQDMSTRRGRAGPLHIKTLNPFLTPNSKP